MNILIFCTYPIDHPRHGGQLRVSNIADSYRAASHNVEVVGVLGSDYYENEKGFVPFPGMKQLSEMVSNPFLMEDYAIGELFSKDVNYFDRLAALIEMRPDVIHVEQPWLFSFAQRYANGKNIKIIYGSQNIEWKLKKEILSTYMSLEYASSYSQLIRSTELNAIANADAVICVSESDANWIASHTSRPIVIAPNGVKAWRDNDLDESEAVQITKNQRYALYCASGHPPNITGFFDLFGGGFGSLKPDEKLIIAGGAGISIKADIRLNQSANLADKVIATGMVDQPCLESLLAMSSCIVLPLTQGGGTNLKTAEALWSEKPIVATTKAMRGFEVFIGSRGIFIADTPSEFKRALRSAMALTKLDLTSWEIEQRQAVLWNNCLRSLVIFMDKLQERVLYEKL